MARGSILHPEKKEEKDTGKRRQDTGWMKGRHTETGKGRVLLHLWWRSLGYMVKVELLMVSGSWSLTGETRESVTMERKGMGSSA